MAAGAVTVGGVAMASCAVGGGRVAVGTVVVCCAAMGMVAGVAGAGRVAVRAGVACSAGAVGVGLGATFC